MDYYPYKFKWVSQLRLETTWPKNGAHLAVSGSTLFIKQYTNREFNAQH